MNTLRDCETLVTHEDEMIKRLNEWKDNVESRGMSVNMNKTKVMISGERQKLMQKAVRWPCGSVVEVLVVIQYSHKWVHKKCSGIKGSMSNV